MIFLDSERKTPRKYNYELCEHKLTDVNQWTRSIVSCSHRLPSGILKTALSSGRYKQDRKVKKSMVSRMLTEARKSGIVKFSVDFPLRRDRKSEKALERLFGLDEASVLSNVPWSDELSRTRLRGKLGALCLQSPVFSTACVLVLVWGTTSRSHPCVSFTGSCERRKQCSL